MLLIGGGSGVVPLMSMLRHRIAACDATRTLLLYSSRTDEDVIYRDELQQMAIEDSVFLFRPTLTRSVPKDWTGLSGRVDKSMIDMALSELGDPRHVFVCGSNGFVENASTALVYAGVDPSIVATERFGPTGV